MAIDLTTSPGGLFPILGKLIRAMRSANDYRGTTNITEIDSAGDSVDDIVTQFTTNKDIIDGLWTQLENHRSSQSGWLSYLRGVAERIVIELADDDVTLVSKDIATALEELISQMEDNSDSVDASTVSASASADAGNTGDAKVVVSVKRKDGLNNELVFAETMELECTSDSYTGGQTAGQETFTLRGEVAVSDALDWQWPAGSGVTTTVTAVDANVDANGNLLTNSDFEDFTSNVPDNWAVLVGTAGTTILRETTTVYDGSSSLEFVGDAGSTLSSIAQTFDSASGTTSELAPNTVYHFSCLGRKSASLAAGVLEISLVDSSNAYITDDQGNNLATTIAHGSLSSSAWTQFSGTFTTPKVLPTSYKLRVRASTALTDGESAFLDHLSLAAATEAYTGGPWVSVHSGATNSLLEDLYTLSISNNFAGDFQKEFDRLFNMKSLGLQLPSNSGGSETVADTLIG